VSIDLGRRAGYWQRRQVETQMSVRALGIGLRVAEVPTFEFRRIHGKSNLRTVPDGWRVLKTILRERWRSRDCRDPQLASEFSLAADPAETSV